MAINKETTLWGLYKKVVPVVEVWFHDLLKQLKQRVQQGAGTICLLAVLREHVYSYTHVSWECHLSIKCWNCSEVGNNNMHVRTHRGGGTGPADPAAAGPMLEGLLANNKLNNING